MTAPDTPIYLTLSDGGFEKYTGSIEDLRAKGWPEVAPPGTLKGGGSVSSALDKVYSAPGVDARLFSSTPPGEKEWERFKQFLATERAD